MKLKTLNHWDFFKVILVVEYALAAAMLPVMVVIYFFAKKFAPTAIKVDVTSQSIDITAPSQLIEVLTVIAFGFLLSLILAALKAWVLMLLCRYTPLGNIMIGNTKFGRLGARSLDEKALS